MLATNFNIRTSAMKTDQIMIRKNFLRSTNALIAWLLAILGFGCSINMPVEYGMPHADFIVKGNVTSTETKQPIENIRVGMQGDTVYTDKDGNYQVVSGSYPDNQSFAISFQDIDEATNGSYQDVDTLVDFTNTEFTGGDGHWYDGETTKELNIKLSPKK